MCDSFFVACVNKLLKEQSSGQWNEIPTVCLTHWDLVKINSWKMAFSNEFCRMKDIVLWFKFDKVFLHWFNWLYVHIVSGNGMVQIAVTFKQWCLWSITKYGIAWTLWFYCDMTHVLGTPLFKSNQNFFLQCQKVVFKFKISIWYFTSCIMRCFVRKRWRATAWCGKSKFAISSGWLKTGSVSHPDDIITLP